MQRDIRSVKLENRSSGHDSLRGSDFGVSALHRRCFEPQLPHDNEQISFLQRLGERRREKVATVIRVHTAVCANCDDWRVGVLAIRVFDVSGCPFAIENWHLQIHQDTVEFYIAHRDADRL